MDSSATEEQTTPGETPPEEVTERLGPQEATAGGAGPGRVLRVCQRGVSGKKGSVSHEPGTT